MPWVPLQKGKKKNLSGKCGEVPLLAHAEPPCSQHPPPERYTCCNWADTDSWYQPKVPSLLRVHFLFTCYGFDTCWYFIIVSYKTVSALKIQFHPVTPTCHNHWCFLCLHSFHLKFFHVFLWLDSSFLFSTHPLLFLTVLLRWSRPTVNCTFLLGFFCCWLVGWLVFLGPHPQHMKVPRLGVESELQSLATATATATADRSCIFNLRWSLQQRRILNALSQGLNPRPHGY